MAEAAMLSTLLATKLHRPRPTGSLVARPRLTRRLDEGLRHGHPLILVVTPAGYGKTTLVTEWLAQTGTPCAWLSLDEADNDPFRFFTYLVAALEKTLGLPLPQPLPDAFPMMPQAPEAFVYPLINELVSDLAAGRPVLLALDDYHLITAAAIQEAIVDYLFEEVLSRQPEAMREFLLHTSILERMCAPLCDAVLAGGARGSGGSWSGEPASPSQQILETLERANLFLVPLDDERRWYRYHHLFADVLRAMLPAASRPDRVAALHDRAGDWYAQNGFVGDAYRHALLAGNHARAAGLLEENAWSMALHAEFGTLKRWAQALPADLLAQRPWVCLTYVWALLFEDSEATEA